MELHTLRVVARIRSDYREKFGIPRQSGLVESTRSVVVFEPEYRNPDSLRGLEGFSHLWLIWQFSGAVREDWSPTVRPPRLGGNERLGVFATRSPYRPNPLGLSCVRLIGTEQRPDCGTVLIVAGADLLDGTPIYDVKPYLPYADCRTDAVGGFASEAPERKLTVSDPEGLLEALPEDRRASICEILSLDPRPSYQNDPERIYGMRYSDYDVRFRVDVGTLTLVGCSVCEQKPEGRETDRQTGAGRNVSDV